MTVAKHITQLVKESGIYGILGTISQILGILLIPLLTKALSPSEFGIFGLLESGLVLMGALTVLGLDNSAAIWFYKTDKEEERKTTMSSWFWCQISISMILTAGLIMFSDNIASALFHSAQYGPLVILAAVALPLMTFPKITGNWLRYQRQAWRMTLYSAFHILIKVALIIALTIYIRLALAGVYFANFLSLVIIAVISIFILHSWLALKYFSWARLKEMLNVGLPLLWASFSVWILTFSDRFILQFFATTAEVGLYSLAFMLASGVSLIVTAFQMAYGAFALSIHKDEISGLVYQRVLTLYAWAGCALCTSLSVFSFPLLRLLTTNDAYLAATSILPYLFFTFLLAGARDIASIGSAIEKRTWPISKSIFLGAFVNIALNFALVPQWGKEGSALASMIASLISVIYLFKASQKIYRIPYQFKPAIICFIFSWLIILLSLLMNDGTVGLRFILCLLFIPLGFFLKIFNKQMLEGAFIRGFFI